jgi:hypothetical protein
MEKDIALGSIGSFDIIFKDGKASASLTFAIKGGLSGSLVISEDVAGALIPLLGSLLSKAVPAAAPIEGAIEGVIENAVKSI